MKEHDGKMISWRKFQNIKQKHEEQIRQLRRQYWDYLADGLLIGCISSLSPMGHIWSNHPVELKDFNSSYSFIPEIFLHRHVLRLDLKNLRNGKPKSTALYNPCCTALLFSTLFRQFVFLPPPALSDVHDNSHSGHSVSLLDSHDCIDPQILSYTPVIKRGNDM